MGVAVAGHAANHTCRVIKEGERCQAMGLDNRAVLRYHNDTLGDRLTVGQQALDLLVGVRILLSQLAAPLVSTKGGVTS